MANVLQVASTPTFNELTRAIQEYGTCDTPAPAQEKRILSLSRSVEPTLIQQHLSEITTYAVVVAASYQARDHWQGTSRFDDAVQRYDRLRYLIDTEIEQREGTFRQLKQVDQLLAYFENAGKPSPAICKDTATLCTSAIYGDFTNTDLIDALTANTALDSERSIELKDIAALTCRNENGQVRFTLHSLDNKTPELTDVLQDIRLSLNDLLYYQSVFDPARYSIEQTRKPDGAHKSRTGSGASDVQDVVDEYSTSQSATRQHHDGIDHNEPFNRAQESRTESEATSMATTIDAVVDAPETASKRARRASKTKDEPSAPAHEAISNDNSSSTSQIEDIDKHEEQRHLAAMEKESGAPGRDSYLREAAGYDALSPEQKASCDKDFQAHLEKRTRPIEQREGESKENALLRAKQEYCADRQEHTARHGKIAQTMLKSKINCLNTDRVSFSLMNPDVAKEFLATAFYHNAVTTKDIKSFDRETFAKCKNAALREFAAFASSVETDKAGTKEFNNTFVLGIQRPPIGSPSQNLRIAVSPLPDQDPENPIHRQTLASIFGKCAFYHSNRSGRTPEEREQRKITKTRPESDRGR